jgi:hypothetical protein
LYKNDNKTGALALTTNKSPFIFTKKINTNYKLIPFNKTINETGKPRYLPPVSKE